MTHYVVYHRQCVNVGLGYLSNLRSRSNQQPGRFSFVLKIESLFLVVNDSPQYLTLFFMTLGSQVGQMSLKAPLQALPEMQPLGSGS